MPASCSATRTNLMPSPARPSPVSLQPIVARYSVAMRHWYMVGIAALVLVLAAVFGLATSRDSAGPSHSEVVAAFERGIDAGYAVRRVRQRDCCFYVEVVADDEAAAKRARKIASTLGPEVRLKVEMNSASSIPWTAYRVVNDRTLAVSFRGGGCDEDAVPVAHETTTTVTLGVRAPMVPVHQGCLAIDASFEKRVALKAPLGNRRVIHAS